MTQQELKLKKTFAEIQEVKMGDAKNDNVLRIWCSQYPDTFKFQIRTYKSICDFGRGKPRNMIATISLSIKEVEKILKYMKKEKTR